MLLLTLFGSSFHLFAACIGKALRRISSRAFSTTSTDSFFTTSPFSFTVVVVLVGLASSGTVWNHFSRSTLLNPFNTLNVWIASPRSLLSLRVVSLESLFLLVCVPTDIRQHLYEAFLNPDHDDNNDDHDDCDDDLDDSDHDDHDDSDNYDHDDDNDDDHESDDDHDSDEDDHDSDEDDDHDSDEVE